MTTRYQGYWIDYRPYTKDKEQGVARMGVKFTYEHAGKSLVNEREEQVTFLGWAKVHVTPKFDFDQLTSAALYGERTLTAAKKFWTL